MKNKNDGFANHKLWAVMKAYEWSSVETGYGIPLACPKEGPHKFIPVFNTRKQAVEFSGSVEHVFELSPINK